MQKKANVLYCEVSKHGNAFLIFKIDHSGMGQSIRKQPEKQKEDAFFNKNYKKKKLSKLKKLFL